ncbi:uncharacterized protein VTP21DRAFT_11364 [Calcarisporiella thermophila]|uniref:uncharacterized protein n=1 Tax=Calcarisporiella thermophila TaxID=911321 RepID=UPI0037435D13
MSSQPEILHSGSESDTERELQDALLPKVPIRERHWWEPPQELARLFEQRDLLGEQAFGRVFNRGLNVRNLLLDVTGKINQIRQIEAYRAVEPSADGLWRNEESSFVV